jgi:hypothetical protein
MTTKKIKKKIIRIDEYYNAWKIIEQIRCLHNSLISELIEYIVDRRNLISMSLFIFYILYALIDVDAS